ncbi:MAG: hypothetical protein IPL49_13725 [Saprospirales bacterium]|nr:hypothetical protein [Saprospirales bacterium]MBK8491910.1 hypothetical protein [Saprospirales bacterium]
MTTLSEDIVKKVALQFLKGYYKYRPRGEGETIARLDMIAPGGIVADGHLTFSKEDGSPFLATFEATANDSREEVIFHRQPVLLNMDAMAMAMVTTTVILGVLYAEKWPVFPTLGKYGAIAIFILLVMALFLLVRLLVRRLQRYRYIYAIEQFKHYFADQQWIALAEDVFENPLDKNLKELKQQCVAQGFGLLMIDHHLKAHLVVTPARVQALRKKRRLVRFDDAQAWTRKMTDKLQSGWWAQLPPWLTWINRFRFPDFSFNRFQRSYFNQLTVLAAALAASIAIFHDLYKIPPVIFADEEAYTEELEILTQTTRPETGEYLIDTPFLEQYKKLPQSPNPMDEEPVAKVGAPLARDTVFSSPKELIPGLDSVPLPPEKPAPQRAKPSGINAYDCDRFYGIKGPRYLVLYDLVGEEALARLKLDTIYNAGVEGGLLWMGCFDTGSGEFAIYLGTIFKTTGEASSQKEKLELVLQEEGLKNVRLKIRPLVFKGGG